MLIGDSKEKNIARFEVCGILSGLSFHFLLGANSGRSEIPGGRGAGNEARADLKRIATSHQWNSFDTFNYSQTGPINPI